MSSERQNERKPRARPCHLPRGVTTATGNRRAMPDDSLIVPVQVPSGTLHFAPVKADATAQDVIEVLRANLELKKEVLDDLQEDLWALQRIRREERGRAWEKDELDA